MEVQKHPYRYTRVNHLCETLKRFEGNEEIPMHVL